MKKRKYAGGTTQGMIMNDPSHKFLSLGRTHGEKFNNTFTDENMPSDVVARLASMVDNNSSSA